MLTHYMYLEKREDEELPLSKTALTHRYERRLITTIRNDTNTIDDRMTTTRKQKWEKKTTPWPL